jgi:uncharacterized repeat protein (TIGR01451 family)
MCASLLPELLCLRRLGLIADLWSALKHCRLVGMLMSLAAACVLNGGTTSAQERAGSALRPLMDHRVPPGTWSDWVRASGRVAGLEFQSVRVELPSTGRVTWFLGSAEETQEAAQVRLAVGHTYRVRLSDMPEFPGIELFPSIEMLDRLHPPLGHADTFPIPLTFTIEELEAVVEGRMLTKVVYLEQPQLALPFELTTDTAVRGVSAQSNLIEEADKAGRPLALIRLGGRLPTKSNTPGSFYGSGAPVQVSHVKANSDRTDRSAVRFSPAEPRVQLTSHRATQEPASAKPAAAGAIVSNSVLAEQFPDEYLFDGGDRKLPVHYDGANILGIESEDTISEYRDHQGDRRVKASNRVAIYAPRFAAVRTIQGLSESVNVQRQNSNVEQRHGASLHHKLVSKTNTQRDRLQGVRMRSRAGGIESQTTRRDVASRQALAEHSKLLNAFEDVQFLHDGKFHQSEMARLQRSLRAAASWTRELNPVIIANLTAAQEVYANFKVADITGIEDRHKQPGRLRIIKLADTEVAKPGDVITFTIRFDNLGDQELRFVRLIDNLTPRLEYVDDSATSDLPGSISVDDNGEGSHILRFELDNPIAGKSGGFITFQARVR